jgi:hypothetical protein
VSLTLRRRIPAALVVVAALMTAVACGPSSDRGGASVVAATPLAPVASEPDIPAPQLPFDAQPSTEPTEPPPPPEVPTEPPGSEANRCIDVTTANLGLATAQDRAAARAAADTLERYGPPANVRNAIEYFVGSPGAMFSDPNFATRNKVITDWVKQFCPSS